MTNDDQAKHEGGMMTVNGVMWPCLQCWLERAGGYHAVDWAAFDAATARAREMTFGRAY